VKAVEIDLENGDLAEFLAESTDGLAQETDDGPGRLDPRSIGRHADRRSGIRPEFPQTEFQFLVATGVHLVGLPIPRIAAADDVNHSIE
jgi:hypothetical protein